MLNASLAVLDFGTPFQKMAGIASGPLGTGLEDLAWGCAVIGLAYVAIAFTVGGQRMRQTAKSRLLWICAGILIAVCIGGIVKWLKDAAGNNGSKIFGGGGATTTNTIMPMIRSTKDTLLTILPFK